MSKKVTMYEADDGTLYKTEAGADNRNKKVEAEKVMARLSMSEDEIQEKMEETMEYNGLIHQLMRIHGQWTKFPLHLIAQINESTFELPKKKTLYFKKSTRVSGKDELLFEEKEEDFTDPELHVGELYRVNGLEDVDRFTRYVFYTDKYTKEERLAKKIKNGEKLTEDELCEATWRFETVHEEEATEDGRWTRGVSTVIDVEGELYVIYWQKGLTEMQDNLFFDQPVRVRLEEEVVTIKTKKIVELEKKS